MSGAHKGLLKTLKWQQNVIQFFFFFPAQGSNHLLPSFLFYFFPRDPPWGAVTFKLRVNAFLPSRIPIRSPLPLLLQPFPHLKVLRLSCWGWRGAEKKPHHSISPSVRQEPKIPARDAIWYKSIIMKVQHGAKWVSTSAARGANDKTASLCSLACL